MSKPVQMTAPELVAACVELSKKTGLSPEAVAEKLGKNVEIKAAERPLTDAERSERLTRVSLLARALGIAPTEAESLLSLEGR